MVSWEDGGRRQRAKQAVYRSHTCTHDAQQEGTRSTSVIVVTLQYAGDNMHRKHDEAVLYNSTSCLYFQLLLLT